MSTFQARRVPPDSIRLWVREAFDLCRRQPLAFIAIGAMWAGVWYFPLPFTYLLLLGLTLPLAAGCVVAHAADTSQSPFAVIAAAPRRLWLDLLVAGAAPWIAVVAVIWTVAVVSAPFTVWAGLEFELPFAVPFTANGDWQAFRDLFGVLFLWLFALGFVGWFHVPLMAITGLSPLQAYHETVRGLELNMFVVAIVFVIAWVLLPILSFLSPLMAAPLLSMLSSLMYVSFRHIWLGQGRNAPSRVAMSSRVDMTPAPSRA